MHKTCEAVIFAPRNCIEIPEKLGYTEHNKGVSENRKVTSSEKRLCRAGCFSAGTLAVFKEKWRGAVQKARSLGRLEFSDTLKETQQGE